MGWAGDQSGAGYSPSVPMVTEVSKGGGLQSHPARDRSTALAAGLTLAGSDARVSLPHPKSWEFRFSLPHPLPTPETLLLVSAPVRSGPAHSALGHHDRQLQLRRRSRSCSYGGTSGSKRELEPGPSGVGRAGPSGGGAVCGRLAPDWTTDAYGGGTKE